MFGGYLPEALWEHRRFLAHAVQGFFDNGGKRAYVLRVVGDGAIASSAQLSAGYRDVAANAEYLLTQLAEPASAGDTELQVVSSRGIQAGTVIRLVQPVDAGTPPAENVTVDEVEDDKVTLQGAGGVANEYTRTAIVRVPDPTAMGINVPAGAVITVRASSEGTWGDRLRVRATPTSRASVRLLAMPITGTVDDSPFSPSLTLTSIQQNDEFVQLTGAQALRVGDELEFDNGADPVETRTITGFGTTNAQLPTAGTTRVNFITLPPNPLDNDYSVGPNSVTVTSPTDIGFRALAAGQVTFAIVENQDLEPGHRITIDDGAGNSIDGVLGPGSTATQLVVDLDPNGTYPADFDPGATVILRSATLGDEVRVRGAATLYVGAAVELTNSAFEREYRTIEAIDGDRLTLAGAPIGGSFGEGDRLRTLEFNLAFELTRFDEERRREVVVEQESFQNLSLAEGAFNNAVTAIEDGSQLVELEPVTTPPENLLQPTSIDFDQLTAAGSLTGGDDGAPPEAADYAGDPFLEPGERTGIRALEDIDQISIIAAPAIAYEPVHSALIEQCERLKDRFAVLDPRRGRTVAQVQEDRREYDTRYAALYYPWVKAFDPSLEKEIVAPPSGSVVGIYARTDIERGVHKAPANAVVRGATDIERVVNKGQQDILNPPPNQINVIRDFRSDGRGIRVWGARCITSESNWKYVNVRRLFIFLEESIDEGTQWVVFEPNDQPLWSRVVQSVSAFLTRVWRDGALQGATPEEAFYVKCDRTTMTQDDIDNGRLIMLIGVAPVKPAEFVVIRIGQWAGGGSVEEQ
jgi:Phage tail sheath protein subtilisin-like domain/Phage tail sheath C-terminal domain